MPNEGFDIDPTAVLDAGNQDDQNIDDQNVDDQNLDDQNVDDQNVDDQNADDKSGDDAADDADKSDDDKSGDDADKDDKAKGGKGDDDIDLRKAAKELRESLNKLREIDPKAAKALRSALGHDLAYQESFKTPQEARVFKAAVDAVGGPEAIAQMQEQIAYSQEIDSAAEVGDPKVLDTFAKDFPDGYKKLMPHYLDSVKKMDREAYAQAIQPHLIDNLEAAGVGNVLAALQEAAQNGDADAVKKIAANLAAWYGGQKQTAAKFRTDSANPEREKIDGEWKKLNDEKEKGFWGGVSKSINEKALPLLSSKTKPYLQNVPLGQQQAFLQSVTAEAIRRINGDKTYTAQDNALSKAKNRDANKIVAFRTAKFESVLEGAIEKVAKDFGYKPGQKPAAGAKPGAGKPGAGKPPVITGAGASSTNPQYVDPKFAPKFEDLDLAKMGGKDKALTFKIAGKGVPKSGPYKGRWISWRPKQA